MSKAAELAALIGSQTALSNRNLIINGSFQVWQRGTSTTSDGYQTADRYQGSSQNGAATMSQQSFTIGQTSVPGEPQFYYRHNQTTQATDYMPNIQHRIEGVRSLAGQRVTLSVYAKASKSVALKTYIFQHFGSGGSPSAGVAVENSPTIATLTTSWQRVTYTFDVDSINGKTLGTNGDDYLAVYLQFPMSDTYNVDLALLQLEVGEQAQPFEHRSFADELERCKRYYQQIGSGYGKASSTSAFDCSVTFNPPMRDNPAVSDNGTVIQITNITSADHNQSSVGCSDTDTGVTDGTYGGGRVRFSNFSGLTSGTTYAIDHTGSQGGAAEFDAEL